MRGTDRQIEAIDRHTTADLVVERIASVIKDRKLSAGERLPGEHELVEQLKVSRPILREALARLQSMGLVDFQFHRKLLDIAGNVLMQNLMEVIYEFVLTQMARTTPSQRDNQMGRRLHKTILKAVREHDPDAAAEAMQQHMQAVLDRLTPAAEKHDRSVPQPRRTKKVTA